MNRHDRRALASRARRELGVDGVIEASTGSTIRAVAHHEAAHAVAHLVTGEPFARLQLRPRPMVLHASPEQWRQRRERPIAYAVIALAGPCSDAMMAQAEGVMSSPAGNADDLAAAHACAVAAIVPGVADVLFPRQGPSGRMVWRPSSDSEADAVADWLAASQWVAMALVGAHWNAIGRLAAAVDARGVLSRLEVSARVAVDHVSGGALEQAHEAAMQSMARARIDPAFKADLLAQLDSRVADLMGFDAARIVRHGA